MKLRCVKVHEADGRWFTKGKEYALEVIPMTSTTLGFKTDNGYWVWVEGAALVPGFYSEFEEVE